MTGENYHRNGWELLPKKSYRLDTVYLRHLDITQDCINHERIVIRTNLLNGFLSVFGFNHIKTRFDERQTNYFPDIVFIIHDQYSSESHASSFGDWKRMTLILRVRTLFGGKENAS